MALLTPEAAFNFTRVPVEGEKVLRQALADMERLVSPNAPTPHLELVADLGGTAGLYARGLILIGVSDCDRLAHDLLARNPIAIRARVAKIHEEKGHAAPDAAGTLRFLRAAVMGRILAHEYGHYLRFEAGAAAPFASEEAAADYLAGAIDELRGRDPVLGKLVFQAIGCTALVCSHPSPAGRAYAYVKGRGAA